MTAAPTLPDLVAQIKANLTGVTEDFPAVVAALDQDSARTVQTLRSAGVDLDDPDTARIVAVLALAANRSAFEASRGNPLSLVAVLRGLTSVLQGALAAIAQRHGDTT